MTLNGISVGYGTENVYPVAEKAAVPDFCEAFIDRLRKESQKEMVEEKKDESKKLSTDEMMQKIHEEIEQILVKIENGEAEPSYQIGSRSFTEREWDKLLEEFDSIQEAIRKLMKEERERREASEARRVLPEDDSSEKNDIIQNESIMDEFQALLSEVTSCTYPPVRTEDEAIRYITTYTEDGIYCRKAEPIGSSSGYLWFIPFSDSSQYDKVMEYLNQFDAKDNLRFASHENFWQDFLEDKIDTEDFIHFFNQTNHGIPDYTIIRGDSMYFDKEKVKYASYMNPPESWI